MQCIIETIFLVDKLPTVWLKLLVLLFSDRTRHGQGHAHLEVDAILQDHFVLRGVERTVLVRVYHEVVLRIGYEHLYYHGGPLGLSPESILQLLFNELLAQGSARETHERESLSLTH